MCIVRKATSRLHRKINYNHLYHSPDFEFFTMLAAVGQPVPNTEHAVSVSLPSWKATVGYEEGEEWVVSKMRTGYPRFFIHLSIQELQNEVLKLHGRAGEAVMLFPTIAVANRCEKFFHDRVEGLAPGSVRVLVLAPVINKNKLRSADTVSSGLACVFFPKEYFSTAKQVWQHSGDGVSSRRGEFCLKALRDGFLKPVSFSPINPKSEDVYTKGPRRYQRPASQNGIIPALTANPEPTPIQDRNPRNRGQRLLPICGGTLWAKSQRQARLTGQTRHPSTHKRLSH